MHYTTDTIALLKGVHTVTLPNPGVRADLLNACSLLRAYSKLRKLKHPHEDLLLIFWLFKSNFLKFQYKITSEIKVWWGLIVGKDMEKGSHGTISR